MVKSVLLEQINKDNDEEKPAAAIALLDFYEIGVNDLYESGKTIIHLLAENGQNETLKWLMFVKDDVDIKTKDNEGNTALHCAVREGFLSCATVLLESIQDVQEKAEYVNDFNYKYEYPVQLTNFHPMKQMLIYAGAIDSAEAG